jgi:hypothetical protein
MFLAIAIVGMTIAGSQANGAGVDTAWSRWPLGGGSSGTFNNPYCLAVDKSNSVIVTGTISPAPDGNYCTRKYTQDCCNDAGDANDDGQTNVGDAVYIINFVFKGGPAPPCPNEADTNADCQINVGDGVYLLNFIFKWGTPAVCGCVN